MTHVEQSFRRHSSSSVVWVLLALTFFASIPVFYPQVAELEGEYLAVVKNVKISEIEVTEDGVLVGQVEYKKLRHCKFLRLVWFDKYRRRHAIISDPPFDLVSKTYPPGEYKSGPWLIVDLKDIEGSYAHTQHQCHPFWTTVTAFYPTQPK